MKSIFFLLFYSFSSLAFCYQDQIQLDVSVFNNEQFLFKELRLSELNKEAYFSSSSDTESVNMIFHVNEYMKDHLMMKVSFCGAPEISSQYEPVQSESWCEDKGYREVLGRVGQPKNLRFGSNTIRIIVNKTPHARSFQAVSLSEVIGVL